MHHAIKVALLAAIAVLIATATELLGRGPTWLLEAVFNWNVGIVSTTLALLIGVFMIFDILVLLSGTAKIDRKS